MRAGTLLGICLALSATPAFAQNANPNGESPLLALFREKILLKRINYILGYRLVAAQRCAKRTRNSSIEQFAVRLGQALRGNAVPEDRRIRLAGCPVPTGLLDAVNDANALRIILPISAQGVGTLNTPAVLEMMALYAESERHRTHLCTQEINEGEAWLWKSERKPFTALENLAVAGCAAAFAVNRDCLKLAAEATYGIDPSCALPTERNWTPDGSLGGHDLNSCVGAVQYTESAITAKGTLKSKETTRGLQNFVYLLSNTMQERIASGAKTVDLEEIFKSAARVSQVPQPSSEMLLGYLAHLYATGKSLLGSVEPRADRVWRTALREGLSPEEALGVYNERMQLLDFFRDANRYGKSKGIRLQLGGQDVTSFDRHEFMAAFLACHYSGRGDEMLARSMPRMLGIAYESKDFVSHLREGMSLAASRREFQRDTSRYSLGSRLGMKMCPAATAAPPR